LQYRRNHPAPIKNDFQKSPDLFSHFRHPQELLPIPSLPECRRRQVLEERVEVSSGDLGAQTSILNKHCLG